MTLPNFILIGASKSGTTAVYRLLGQHPDVFCSKPKEPNFFLLDGETDDFIEPNGEPRPVAELGVASLAAYEALFERAGDARAIGEASVAYMPDPRVAQRIHALMPEVRLIAMLRNPVEAAFSGYLMTRGHGVEPCGTFEDALLQQDRRESGRYFDGLYIQPGFYFRHLQRFRACFPDDRISVHLYEDFSADPQAVLRSIFRFLGVDDSFRPEPADRVNLSGVPRSMILHRFLTGRTNPLGRLVLPLIPNSLRGALITLRNRNLSRPEIAPETRRHLIEIFRDDISELARYLGRDLSHWLR